MVMAGAGEAPVSCLLREGRSILPSPSEAAWNSSTESPIVAHNGDGGPPRAEPMTMESEPSTMGEGLMPLKRSVMNSKTPKMNNFAEGEATT
jgi:hypothetical protein